MTLVFGVSGEQPVLKVALSQRPLQVQAVTNIGGYVGQRIRANQEIYLKGFDIDRYTRMVEVKRQRDWWWIGEQPGKWLESAVLASRQSSDAALAEKAHGILRRLEAAQEESGYLGITDPVVRTTDQPLRGMDPYELYFMLHGLLTAAAEFNDPSALTAARRLGDYFEAHIGPGKAEFWPGKLRPPENRGKTLDGHSEIAGHSVHYGWEGTLLIDPMLRLYQATGEKRYLDWARWVVGNLDKWSGWGAFSKLDQVAEGKLGVNELQPYVHAHTFQMNFLGFLRLYQITGDESLLRKVRGAWEDVASRQMYITGGVSVGEHYERGYNRPLTGNVVETCATMSWMQLTEYLLELTGEPRYADAIERLLLNHVFASQTIDGDCYRYHTPPNGFKPEAYFHGPDCCTSSGHRIVAMLPGFFYAMDQEGLYVNQYVPSVVRFSISNTIAVSLETETSYPETERIILKVSPEKAATFTVSLRIPAWSETPSVRINGEALAHVERGAYARVRRVWKPGDLVTIGLPMKTQWVRHDHFNMPAPRRLPGGELIYSEINENASPAPYALVRGPLVYALDTIWWTDTAVKAPYDVGCEVGVLRDAVPVLAPTPPRTLGPVYEVPVRLVNGKSVRARLVPFTNVGRWYRDDEPKPASSSRAFSYAIWMQDADGAGFERLAQEWRRIEDLESKSIDFVLVGDAQSEKAHRLAGKDSRTGIFQGRQWRDAGEGANFSYELKVSTEAPSALVVTYWGGDEGNRVFDILANETKLATQKLESSRPNEFIEVVYPLPFSLVQGKTDSQGQKVERVTVRFQAHPGALAGGIFGLRTTRAEK